MCESTGTAAGVTRRVLRAWLGVGVLVAMLAAPASAAAGQVPADTPAPTPKALSGVLIDRRSGKVLWSLRRDKRLGPASCTKIMTALLVLERYKNLRRYITAPRAVASNSGVDIGLRVGDRITVRQALNALMVKSANDAALTLATAVSGSERAFVVKMNRRAAKLGLTRTHFVNCRGKPVAHHSMSAYDLAKLGRYAMRDSRFRKIVRTKTTVVRWPRSHAVSVTSHNRLLNHAWGDGIKTGATGPTLMVLVGSGRMPLAPGSTDAVPLIVVTMREPSRNQEETDAVALLKWGAALYERRQLVSAGDLVTQIPSADGTTVGAFATAGLTDIIRKAAPVTLVYRWLHQPPLVQAPPEGDPLGTVSYRSDGRVIGKVPLVAGSVPSPSPAP